MADLREVQRLAERLIEGHLDDTWSFVFDRAKTRAGKCDFKQRQISISRYLAAKHSDEQVRQTLLHEIAHAMAGHGAGHGPGWQRVAREIGYLGGRTHDAEIANEYAKWVGLCPAGHEIFRFRRPQARPMSCARCSRRFDERHLIRWRERELS